MKLFYAFLLVAGSLAAHGQVVHPAGAPTVAVNWQTNWSAPLTLDLDGDNVADIKFQSAVYTFYFPNDTPGLVRAFTLSSQQAGVQVAADSVRANNAHRFQTGQPIAHGLRWDESAYGVYLNYTPLVNGNIYGTATGFFQDGQPGYVVVRKLVVNNIWHYWWLYAATSAYPSNWQVKVDFYGTSLGTPLATNAPAAATALAYPNPSPANWLLPAGSGGTYRLFDCAGRLVGQGLVQPAQPRVEGQNLAPGFYWLEREEQGRRTTQRLGKY